ncbi:GDP-mannose 4,6-dehydratase, partial [Oceanispirochaeta sp.]|uniref:GDP-mannose 4,6-dehydratase n=1 Tax=Oceanispirochaeta sp. TaxID=2035350 RepID=UPI00261C52B9
MKTILVTGGAGFLGSHLCRSLLERGDIVICLDNLSSGSEKNIESLKEHHDFQFIKHDITEPFDFQVDQIYNLACPASPYFYGQFPIETAKSCSIGVINVLETARRSHAEVLQASTSEVYGNPLVHPQKEAYLGNVNSIGPRSCYDEGKRFAETLFFDYHRKYNIPIKIVRIFNTYGP